MSRAEHPPAGMPDGAGVPASTVVEGLLADEAPGIETVELAPVVAAALRAALDLLVPSEGARRPLGLWWDEGALEVRCPEIHREGCELAAGLLETIEGSLGPDPGKRSAWVLRVPRRGARTPYLMLEQGTLGLAVPWHAVLRVRLVDRGAMSLLGPREGIPVLPPFVGAQRAAAERPVVLLGLGLKRAFLVADRLVWRMAAEPVQPVDPRPAPAVERTVQTSAGEVYWVPDLARLFQGVEPPVLLPASPGTAPSAGPRPGRTPGPDSGAGARERALSPGARLPERMPTPRPSPRLFELRREHVEPLEQPPRASEHARVAAPRALVIEDSIVGRIFLCRLLEQQGFAVEIGAAARDLGRAIQEGPWALVLVDVSLPDSPVGEHLAGLAREVRSTGRASLVALVRDRDDERLAARAGIARVLRKPFEKEDLIGLLSALRVTGGES